MQNSPDLISLQELLSAQQRPAPSQCAYACSKPLLRVLPTHNVQSIKKRRL